MDPNTEMRQCRPISKNLFTSALRGRLEDLPGAMYNRTYGKRESQINPYCEGDLMMIMIKTQY